MTRTRAAWGVVLIAAAMAVGTEVRDLRGVAAAQRVPRVPAPVFEVDPGWPVLPNSWKTGNVTSVAVGPNDHVWFSHRSRMLPDAQKAQAAPPILEFDERGRFVTGWGGDAPGFDWPGSEHGIFVDGQGNVWLTGSGPDGGAPTRVKDNMVLKFTNAGKFLLQIGGRGQPGGNHDTKNLDRAADVDVYAATKEAFVADGYGNRRVIVFDAETGAFKRMWGAFGNPPDSDPPTPLPGTPAPAGAQAGGGAASEPARDLEGPGSPHFGNRVHGIRVSRDGLVYVADRSNRRVQVFTVDGMFVDQVFINRSGPSAITAAGLAFSPAPDQTYMYVADFGNSHVVVVHRRTLEVLYQFGARSSRPGDFQGLHHLAADSMGNLYTAEVAPGNRAQRFAFKGLSSVLPPNAVPADAR